MNTKQLNSKQILRCLKISYLTNTDLKEPLLSDYNTIKNILLNNNIYYCKKEEVLHIGINIEDPIIEYNTFTENIFIDDDIISMFDLNIIYMIKAYFEYTFSLYVNAVTPMYNLKNNTIFINIGSSNKTLKKIHCITEESSSINLSYLLEDN